MGDSDALPPSKKRAAGRELSRDNPGLEDEEDVSEQETGTFQKASDEVLATRRIVKVRRQQSSAAPAVPSSNPFAGVRLVPPPAAPGADATIEAQSTEQRETGKEPDTKGEATEEIEGNHKELEEKPMEAVADSATEEKTDPVEKTAEPDAANQTDNNDTIAKEAEADAITEKEPETEQTDGKEVDDGAERATEANTADEKAPEGDKNENHQKEENGKAGGASTFNSFQQLSNSQNAFTGLAGSGFSSSTFSFGSNTTHGTSFSFGTSNNGTTPLFSATAAPIGGKAEGSSFPSMQEVPRETGEENESTVFSAESALFEFLDGGWKERGKGEVKVNVLKTEAGKSRLVMRARGNLRLILNASIFTDMKLTHMDKKGVTFACVNSASEGKDSLSTFALKFKEGSAMEEFCDKVQGLKDKMGSSTALKTPENSPKAAASGE